MFQQFVNAWRTRMPYMIFMAGCTPAYFYIFSDRHKMNMQWKKEIQDSDIKLKEDESELTKAVNPNRHLVLTMAHEEMAERNKRGLNETYRPARVGDIDSQYVEQGVSPETLRNREKRAKIRALKRRTAAGNSSDNNNDADNTNDNKTDDKIS